MNGVVETPILDEVKRRTRKIQKTLMFRDEDFDGGEPPLAAPRRQGPPPCRAALANWPVEWREQWGRLANALEDAGLDWQEAEARAFIEVWKRRRAEAKAQTVSLGAFEVERN